MKTEVIDLASNEGVTLTTYVLDSSGELSNARVRPAVLIFPGGGYRFTSDREAEPVAMTFLAQGYHAFVLRYTVSEEPLFPKPLEDAQAALNLIRDRAEEWGVDPDKIAVCGFSAGGHLAAALGTMGDPRPNALILGYAVILQSLSRQIAADMQSLHEKVDANTPPTFLFTTGDDRIVPVENSLHFAMALDQAGVPFALHVFQSGIHGLSLAKPHTADGRSGMVNPGFARWVELCMPWLEQQFGSFPVSEAAQQA